MNANARNLCDEDPPEHPFLVWRVVLLSLLASAVLVACDDPPAPQTFTKSVADVERDRRITSGIASDPSVPSAQSVLTPPSGDPKAMAGPALAPLTKDEESQAMPKAGQANDHSSPKLGSSPAASAGQ